MPVKNHTLIESADVSCNLEKAAPVAPLPSGCFPILDIDASAGGIAAIEAFFSHAC